MTRLKQFRKDSDLTQKECAYKLGVTLRGYVMMEDGKRGVPLHHYKLLGELFDVNVVDIFAACYSIYENSNGHKAT